MKLHMLATGFAFISSMLMNIPSIQSVGFGLVLATAGIQGLLTFFASLALAKWASRLPGALGVVLLVIALVNDYTSNYSLAYMMGTGAHMMAETPIRYVLSACFTAMAVSSMCKQWWPEMRRA
jgi:hypothetical protein